MKNLINKPSSRSDKMSGSDFSFKVPKPVSNFKVPKLDNNYKRNTSNLLAFEASTSNCSSNITVSRLGNQYRNNSSSLFPSEASSTSIMPSADKTNFKIPRLGNEYRNNNSSLFPSEASSKSIMPSADKTNFKVPRLGNEYRSSNLSLFPLEASTSTMASTSASSTVRSSTMSMNSGKKTSLFNSGLDLTLVNRGTFGRQQNSFLNKNMGQQMMLPDSSRMMELTKYNDDNQSVAGSVMSNVSNMSAVNTLKDKLRNRFESMENIVRMKCLNMPAFDHSFIINLLRSEQENIIHDMEKEFTMAMSFRDIDTCSIFNETSKTLLGGLMSKNQSQYQNVSAVKSSKDILSELPCSKQSSFQRNQIQFITNFETSRRDEDRGMLNDDHENDETVLFRKPKVPKIAIKKPIQESVVYQKRPTKPNQSSKNIIYLERWFPVAVGDDLKLSGTDKEKQMVETKPIKKRIDNRTVELIDGKKCVIEGSPNSSIVSSFPKNIVQKLKNGLHAHWKILQRDISNCQKNFTSISQVKNKEPNKKHLAIEYTPRTRKVAKEDELLRNKKNCLNSPLNSSTPIKSKGTEKINDKSLGKRHPVVMIDKNEINKSKKISPDKSSKGIQEKKKISPGKSAGKIKEGKRISPEKSGQKISPGKKVEQVQRSRSGRTIKPLGSFWTDSSVIYNVNKKPVEERKSKDETVIVHRDSLDGNRKRKRDNDNSNHENGAKPAKLKKNSPEERKKEHSPVKKSPARRKKKSPQAKKIAQKKNTKLPAIKSPVKTKSPVRISPVKKQNDQKSKNKKTQKNEKNQSMVKSDKKKKVNSSYIPDFEGFDECQLDDIELPEISAEERKAQLSKSQLRIATMETPPLQYFSQNLRILNTTATPHQSPDWQISQHSQSAVRRFGERRAKTFKQKIPTGSPAPVMKNIRKSPRNKDVKTVTDWIGDKDVKSPKKRSKLINMVIPSRRQLEEDDESESD